jgi:plastocyanin
MRTRWYTLVAGTILAIGLMVWDVPAANAQKGGGGKGGGGGGGAHYSGGHYSGGHYGGNYGYHHNDHNGHGRGFIAIYVAPGYYGGYYNGYYPASDYGYSSAYAEPSEDLIYVIPPGANDQNGSYQSYYSPPPKKQAGTTLSVTINESGYGPDTLDIKLGTTVRWINNTTVPRSLAQHQQSWTGPVIGNGQTYSWTFSEPGDYVLHDSRNPKLKMTVNVQP